MDNFSLNKALNHFGIDKDEFMAICKKYEYNQLTIEQHLAKEKILPEIEKWLSEHDGNSIRIELKDREDITALIAPNYCSHQKEIFFYRDNDYAYEKCVELTEDEVDFTYINKLIFEDYTGEQIKELSTN